VHSLDKESTAKISLRIGVGPKLRPRQLTAGILCRALTLAVLATLPMAARPAYAQTEEVLYSFTGSSDGSQPESSLTMNNGNLYGTTYAGGFGFGTVYELSPNGTGGWTETTLYSFCPVAGCADGQNPTYSYVIFDNQGNMYGTAFAGGANGYGVVFELTNSGGTWTESVLYSFANSPDGANPGNGLIMDGAGNVYGMTFAGGNGKGCVFELSPGSTWTEKVIYDINSTHSGLTQGPPGTIYGTTYGTVYELTLNGSGVWVPNVLFTFNPADFATEGSNPVGTLVLDSAGNLYGTTLTGGANNAGVVYRLSPGNGGWTETLLYSFNTARTALILLPGLCSIPAATFMERPRLEARKVPGRFTNWWRRLVARATIKSTSFSTSTARAELSQSPALFLPQAICMARPSLAVQAEQAQCSKRMRMPTLPRLRLPLRRIPLPRARR